MNSLEELETIIASRGQVSVDQSWTARLLADGRETCARKFGEEAIETVIAGTSGSKAEIIHETADLLYHLLVLLKANDVTVKQVMNELEQRRQQSGLVEKFNRDPVP